VDAIVSADRSLLPSDAQVLAADMDARIVASGARELDNLSRALRGRFVPTGGGGEPKRKKYKWGCRRIPGTGNRCN
jgi:cobalamin biosynthesis Mg chelatase CobN